MENSKMSQKDAGRFWKLAYRLNDNIKTYMDNVYKNRNGIITSKEINDLENYKVHSWENIIRNTIKSK